MLSIKPNSKWVGFSKIYGKEVLHRYRWFLFEFGKRSTRLFYKHLLQSIRTIPGTTEYRKRLMITEIRDKGAKAWWAIVASGKQFGKAEYDPNRNIFQVATRFPGIEGDPVYEILELMGPWTVETLPFIPSQRAGQVVMRTVTEAEVESVKNKNFKNGALTKTKMIKYGLMFEPRHIVYRELRVMTDVEVEAIRMEFGLKEKAKPHWRPSLRWIKREGIRKLENDKELMRVWTDPKFLRFKLIRHLRTILRPAEVKRIQKFQNQIRGNL
jgi:hypothetical protein